MRRFIFFLVLLTASFQMTGQNTVTVFINNKKAAGAIINPDKTDAVLIIKKSKYKKLKPFILVVSGEYIGSEAYKRSLEISGETSIILNEIKNHLGHFDLSDSKTVKLLLTRKSMPVYLLLNPSNPAMAIPSRRVFLGNVVMN